MTTSATAQPKPALAESTDDAVHPSPGRYFLDVDGRTVSFDERFSRFNRTGPSHVLRMGLEELLVLGIGSLEYQWQREEMEQDWDNPGLRTRFTTFDAVRFDDNEFHVNTVKHPFAGSVYYLFARANNLELAPSLATAVLLSAIWDYVFEINEKVSLNDLVMTPMAGLPIGEAWFKLGEYVNSSTSAHFVPTLASYSLGLPRRVHDTLDAVPPAQPSSRNSVGLSADYRHRSAVLLTGGFAHGPEEGERSTRFVSGISWSWELAAMPGYLRPGHYDTFFSNGNFTAVDTQLLFGDDGLEEVRFFALAELLGYQVQSLVASSHEEMRGTALRISLSSAFERADRDLPGFRDQWASAHLLGPTVDMQWFAAGSVLRLRLAWFADFGTARALAFVAYRETHEPGVTKSVLERHGYYFGVGTTAKASLSVEHERTEMGVRGTWSWLDSVEGMDRFQERVTNDFDVEDHLSEYEAWVSYELFLPLFVSAALTSVRRESQIEHTREVRDDTRMVVGVGLRF